MPAAFAKIFCTIRIIGYFAGLNRIFFALSKPSAAIRNKTTNFIVD
nr:MAG TPA: hypothetical protein [Inoviridae sp.]